MMKAFRKFDRDQDSCYHFLNTPDLYITPDILENVFQSIGDPLSQEDCDVMDFIKQTELLKMQYCLGEISLNEKKERCLDLDNKFCETHSCWAYSCGYYKKFYSALGCDE